MIFFVSILFSLFFLGWRILDEEEREVLTEVVENGTAG